MACVCVVTLARCSWEACCGLLADIGLLLEYAQLICDRAQALDAYRLCYLPHAACLARARLALLCAMGWPALTAKVGLSDMIIPIPPLTSCTEHLPQWSNSSEIEVAAPCSCLLCEGGHLCFCGGCSVVLVPRKIY